MAKTWTLACALALAGCGGGSSDGTKLDVGTYTYATGATSNVHTACVDAMSNPTTTTDITPTGVVNITKLDDMTITTDQLPELVGVTAPAGSCVPRLADGGDSNTATLEGALTCAVTLTEDGTPATLSWNTYDLARASDGVNDYEDFDATFVVENDNGSCDVTAMGELQRPK